MLTKQSFDTRMTRSGTGEDIVLILRHFSDPARPQDVLRKVVSVCLVDSKASHPQQRYIEKRWALKTFWEHLGTFEELD